MMKHTHTHIIDKIFIHANERIRGIFFSIKNISCFQIMFLIPWKPCANHRPSVISNRKLRFPFDPAEWAGTHTSLLWAIILKPITWTAQGLDGDSVPQGAFAHKAELVFFFAQGWFTAAGLMNVYLSKCVEILDLANATAGAAWMQMKLEFHGFRLELMIQYKQQNAYLFSSALHYCSLAAHAHLEGLDLLRVFCKSWVLVKCGNHIRMHLNLC